MKNSPALQRKSGSALPPLNGCCKMLLLAPPGVSRDEFLNALNDRLREFIRARRKPPSMPPRARNAVEFVETTFHHSTITVEHTGNLPHSAP
jgi:hypothetical protein